jgi:DNA-directed RNA polymerase specialized sigma24 family protein
VDLRRSVALVGDEATPNALFETFYRTHYTEIARALAYTLGDAELAAEAADEAMARAYPRWDVVGRYDNPAGWVYRVGLNWARSLNRKLARRLPWVEASTATLPPIADPAVAEALWDLDVELRSVVVCRLLLDWSVEDTAAALEIKAGTVKSRLHRALAILQSRLRHLR